MRSGFGSSVRNEKRDKGNGKGGCGSGPIRSVRKRKETRVIVVVLGLEGVVLRVVVKNEW